MTRTITTLTMTRRTLTSGVAPMFALGCFAAACGTIAAPSAAAMTTDDEEDGEDPALRQTVSDDEEIVVGEPVTLGAGHVDLGPRIIDGEWILAARDDTAHPPKWRSLSDVVLQVHDTGALPVPEGEEYSFIKADTGSSVYVVPQTEIPGVVWLGWNTQSPPVVSTATQGVRLRVHAVSGPGHFSLFLQPGNFAPPQLLADKDALADSPAEIFVEANTHTHANWVFTEPGVYLVDLEATAVDAQGHVLSARDTVRFSVGDATSVEEALSAAALSEPSTTRLGQQEDASPTPTAQPSAATSEPQQGDRPATSEQHEEDNSALPWIVGGAVALGLAGAGGAYVRHSRQAAAAQAQAEQGRNEADQS